MLDADATAGSAEVSRRFTAADGVAIGYCRKPHRADGAGAEPLLLLHGLASNLTRWSEFVERTGLVSRHDLLRVDLRGHERSPTRGRICLELWSRDLQQLLDVEGQARAIVVGHSLGAQVAMHLAAQAPQRVAALALIDPVFRSALHGKWDRIARFGPLFSAAAKLVRALNGLGLRRRNLPSLDLRALDEMARRALAASPQAEQAFIRQYSSTRADLRTFRTAHYLQELVEMFRPLPPPSRYRMPTLVLLSTGATFADLDETEAIVAQFPQVDVHRVACHHWPLTEKPDEVRTVIERWCDELPARAGSGLR